MWARRVLHTACLVMCVALWGSAQGSTSPEVSVTGGRIVGSVEQSAHGRTFYAYRSVPFAASPEGDNRFKAPEPVVGWSDSRDTTTAPPMCAQSGRGYSNRGEEDCLYLSVYTPKMAVSPPGDGELLPVLVWLPGGAFIVSGAGAYDPRLLMDRDIVLVVPQYRLGVLGFFYGFSEAPGNFGMLDQVAALRWVQDNIAQFGGDPSKVTLGGDCAGGASALYHVISHRSRDLFQRVISINGSPLNPWAMHPTNRRTMLLISKQLICPRHDMAEMIKCLREKTPRELLEAQMFLLEARDLFVGNANLAPVVQTQSDKYDNKQFLEQHPLQALTDGHFAEVPSLLIASKDVGNYIVDMSIYEYIQITMEEKGEKFKDDVVPILIKEIGVATDGPEAQELWAQYLPGLNGSTVEQKLPGIALMLGDALYNTGILHTARLLNDKAPSHLLRFDFEDGPHSFDQRHPDPALAPPVAPGAGHGDELNYFLPEEVKEFATEEQQAASDLMLDIITNFVNGRSPDWPATTDEGLECAVVNKQGTLEVDTFMPPDRLKTSEMIFRQQHKIPLLRMEKEKLQKDEL